MGAAGVAGRSVDEDATVASAATEAIEAIEAIEAVGVFEAESGVQ